MLSSTIAAFGARVLLLGLAAIAVVEADINILRGRATSGYDYVDPLIGTVNGGHVFAGATLPFGMAKAVADTNIETQAGFASDDGNITGFSHMHDSGTGGSPSLGNFPLFAHAGCPGDQLNACKFASVDRAIGRIPGSVSARPGYFAIGLNSNIRAEMTVTNHTALYRFTFPKTSASNDSKPGSSIADIHARDSSPLSPLIIFDLTDLPGSRSKGSASVDPNSGRISGSGTFNPSFGIGSYQLYFCADFLGASIRDSGTWTDNNPVSDPKNISVGSSPPAGAFTRFNAPANGQLLARVGVSFISISQACSNAEKEIPTFDFDGTLAAAGATWRQKLSVVQVDQGAVDVSFLTIFWSGIYRSMISPQDYTGENPLWQNDEPYYDSYYCLWDSFRSVHQLITILDPVSQTRMVRSLIDIYRHEGKLPDCRMSLCKGFTQGGSNADVVLADSYLKGINDGVDWATAYEAVVSDAEVEPADWSVEGRGGLESWKTLHYIPVDDADRQGGGPFTRSVSRTVEYAYDDFCIASMAKGLGHTADYEKYKERSTYWKNLFNPSQTASINGIDTKFTGFLQPRLANGTFGFQDPIRCSPLLGFTSCFLNPTGGETYEGSAWMYTFFVPGDMAALISTLGGASSFSSRLDFLHESGLLYIGDEQAFLTVFQYHHAGRPGKSAARAHAYVPSQFNTTLQGIPGNDDSGAMGSFATFTMMGLFPNPGQDVYYITPPFFPSISITSPVTGKTATVKNVNFDVAYTNVYIQSATLDGQVYTKNWISHAFFLDGGILELTLGGSESAWGTLEADLPPSLSTMG